MKNGIQYDNPKLREIRGVRPGPYINTFFVWILAQPLMISSIALCLVLQVGWTHFPSRLRENHGGDWRACWFHAETVFLRDLKQGETVRFTMQIQLTSKDGQRIVLTLNNTIAVFLPARFSTRTRPCSKINIWTYFGKAQRGKILRHKLRFSNTAVGPTIVAPFCVNACSQCVCVYVELCVCDGGRRLRHTTLAALTSFQTPPCHVLFFSTFPVFEHVPLWPTCLCFLCLQIVLEDPKATRQTAPSVGSPGGGTDSCASAEGRRLELPPPPRPGRTLAPATWLRRPKRRRLLLMLLLPAPPPARSPPHDAPLPAAPAPPPSLVDITTTAGTAAPLCPHPPLHLPGPLHLLRLHPPRHDMPQLCYPPTSHFSLFQLGHSTVTPPPHYQHWPASAVFAGHDASYPDEEQYVRGARYTPSRRRCWAVTQIPQKPYVFHTLRDRRWLWRRRAVTNYSPESVFPGHILFFLPIPFFHIKKKTKQTIQNQTTVYLYIDVKYILVHNHCIVIFFLNLSLVFHLFAKDHSLGPLHVFSGRATIARFSIHPLVPRLASSAHTRSHGSDVCGTRVTSGTGTSTLLLDGLFEDHLPSCFSSHLHPLPPHTPTHVRSQPHAVDVWGTRVTDSGTGHIDATSGPVLTRRIRSCHPGHDVTRSWRHPGLTSLGSWRVIMSRSSFTTPFCAKPNIMVRSFSFAFGGISWAWFIMSFSNQRKPSREIAIVCNWCVWSRALKEKTAAIRAATWQGDFVARQRSATCRKAGENILGNP